MRNIVLLQESHDPISSIHPNFTHFSYDYSSKLLYASTSSSTIVEYHVGKKQIIHEIDLLALDVISPDATIVALHTMHNMGTVCVATSAGDIIVYDTQSKEVECVGIVDSGITTMSWSPDFEMVVMGTKKGTLIAMTKDWEVLTEVQPTHTVQHVTWRGDGAFFATSGPSQASQINELCVWERTCAPHSRATMGTGEVLLSGSGLISWRPAGQLIAALSPSISSSPSSSSASSSSSNSAQRVIFFERNGLRHGEFNLRGSVSKGEATQLGWSCDSETLSTLVDGTLQMWNSSNYHWALKKEVFLRAETEKEGADQLLAFEWDPEDPHCLRAFSKGGIFSEIKFTYEYTVCDVPIKENRYSCGVVDGNEIKFTPFRQVVIPPPMCSFSVKQTATVVSFAFGNPENEADPEAVVLTSDNNISFYTKSKPTSPISPLKLISSVASPSLPLNGLRQPVWISPSLYAIQTKSGKDEIVQITFSHDFLSIASVSYHSPSSHSSHPHILRIARNFNSTNIIVELSDGSLQHYPPSSSALSPFPLPCIRIASLSLPSNSALPQATVGLTATGKLYINSTLLSSVCNSFFIQGTFLLFTTTNHKLHFLPLATFSPSVPPTPESCEIERGGVLVAAVAFDVRVVLQMPRGNLETIHPHTLCLALARTHLDQSPPAYHSAFILLRKYRLDLNILYDYQPSSFLSHVHHFVSQLATIEFLNLFISSLRKDIQKFYTDVEVTQDEQKLNSVCDALRGALIAADEAKYLLPILTTYVKKDPAELGETLQLIQKLRDSAQGSTTTASKALDYVIFLVDVDRLYDVALGLYDFDLVLMVAQKSQKDPKEYLPFITGLQSMDTHTQRYVIDSQLGRWDSALRNLAAVGEDKLDEVLALTSKHSLFQTALDIYATNPEGLKQVYATYGDYLAGLGRSEAAGYAYLNSAQYEKALASFKECSKWREAMHAARLHGLNAEGLRNLAYEIAENLKAVAMHGEAGTLLVEHALDPEAAIVAYVEGRVWDDADRLARLHNRNDLVETHLLPALKDEASSVSEDLVHRRESFVTKIERLKAVRKNKQLLPKYIGGEERNEEDQSDAGSMASGFSRNSAWSDRSGFSSSSTGSTMSYASTSSSGSVVSWQSLSSKGMLSKRKERRKKEHKSRVTGKEGSRHEEEYLVEALKVMIPSTRRQEAVGKLIRALAHFGFTQKAREIQAAFKSFISLVDSSLEILNASALAVHHEKNKHNNNNNNNNNNNSNNNTTTVELPKPFVREQVSWALALWP